MIQRTCTLVYHALLLAYTRRILNYQLIMRMLKRIALVMCVVTAASVLTGCGGDEDAKKKEAGQTKKGKGGKKGLKKAQGTIEKEDNDNEDGGAGKKKPPAPPAPPAKVLSNVEKIQDIRDQCLKSLESEWNSDVKCEKQLETIMDVHACLVKMGALVINEDSAAISRSGKRTLAYRLTEKMEIIRPSATPAPPQQDKCFEDLLTKGKEFNKKVNAAADSAKKVEISEELAKKETREMLNKIFSISYGYITTRKVFQDISRLKKGLADGLWVIFPEMKNIYSILERLSMINNVNIRYLLIRQRKSVVISTVEHVKKTVSEIEKPDRADAANHGPLFVDLTRLEFLWRYEYVLAEPENYSDTPMYKDPDVEKVETDLYKKLFKEFIDSSELQTKDKAQDKLSEVSREGLKELNDIKVEKDTPKKQLVEKVVEEYRRVLTELIREMA